MSDEELLAGARGYMASDECAWWPAPGKVLKYVPSQKILSIDTADLAWGMVLEAIRVHDQDDPPGPTVERRIPRTIIGRARDGAKEEVIIQVIPARTWDWPADLAPAIKAGLRGIGGWGALFRLSEGDQMAARASFRASYRAAVQASGAIQEATDAGLIEKQQERGLLEWFTAGMITEVA